jgi:type VI secretion system protein ImpF
MARNEKEIRVTASVLDRLIDFEPKSTQEAPKSHSNTLRELKQSVRRDLEWLLNTRCYLDDIDENLEEVRKSVMAFGLPDFTGISAKSHSEQNRLAQAIETAIKNFEPRFLDLKVFLEPISDVDRLMKFRIEAKLDTDPTPEPITFDTVLQLGSGEFEIQEK